MMLSKEVEALARTIWDYHHLNHRLEKADVIVAMGSHDLRVAEWAARLWLDGWAPWLVCSGALGNLTRHLWKRTEADLFAETAARLGVPRERILIEDQSTNTGENILFTDRLLKSRGIKSERLILAHKPYMERRAYATARVYWPRQQLFVTSPPIAFEDYPNAEIPQEQMINIMVGDLQRLRDYPAKGFMIPQEIPSSVLAAFERLVALGFNRHLANY